MFNNLNSPSHSIFTRIIMMVVLVFMVMSFGMWGIGDIFRSAGGPGTVAKVGKMSVSMREYQNALRSRQEMMRERLGKDYSPELAKKLGLEKQALESIINRLVLEQEAASMGMAAGEDDVLNYIAHAPEFQNGGQFSKEQYQAVLQANHRSEQAYIEGLQSQLATKLLLETVATEIPASDDLVYAFYRARFEKRSASMLVIPAVASSAAAPTDKEIKAYYDAHNDKYMVPEYRSFSYVELKPDALKAGINVSDAEVQKAYTDRAEDFHLPERRLISQMVFEKKETADKAASELAAGKTFAEVAALEPVLNKDKLSLGELSKAGVPVAGDEVFALKQGQVTKPVQSSFGWHLFEVEKIIPAGQRPLAEVRAEIIKDITAKATDDAINKLSSSFEDAMGGGATLEDAAKKLGQEVHVVKNVSRDGVPQDGSKITLPTYSNFLEMAFATPDKDHSRMVQAEDNAYYMIHVDSVTAEHAKPLADVTPQVVESVKKEQATKKAREFAEQIAKDLKAGKKLEEALAGKGVAPVLEPSGTLLKSSEAISEGKLKGKGLPPDLVAELFKVKPNGFTGAYAEPDGSFLIARLDKVTAAPDISKEGRDAALLKPIREEIEKGWMNEAQFSYLQYLRRKYPVSINNNAISLPAENEEE